MGEIMDCSEAWFERAKKNLAKLREREAEKVREREAGGSHGEGAVQS